MPIEEKTCRSCGRRITWRKKWERDWAEVRYCSSACRRHGVDERDRQAEGLIRELLAGRPGGVSDSDVTAVLTASSTAGAPTASADRETVRRAARRLVAEGALELLQRGRVVDPSTATGPVLLRRAR